MIRLEQLHLCAGGFALAVDDLVLESGEYMVMLGPTGSGKTVLLETIAGLRRPERGRLWFGDREVTAEAPERRRVGFVYQDYALFPHLDVAGNIGFGLRNSTGNGGIREHISGRGAVSSRVGQLAEMLGIDSLLDRYPGNLSGGEKQRVALARALAIEPEVLLLDEPLSALDRQTRESMRSLLRRLQRELGVTVMHVTHDLDEALAVADKLAVLIGGRIRQTGPPVDVVRHPADAEVARLFGLPNVFPARAATRDGGRFRLAICPEGPTLAAAGPALEGDTWAVIRAEEVQFLWNDGAIPKGIAPGNLLEGTIGDIRVQSVHSCVEVDVPPRFCVHILRPDADRLGLRVGGPVRLYVPPEAIHVCPRGSRDDI